MQRLHTRTKPNGFTLIELLVVIAIIAILAAILFPVFAQARSKARQAACMNNQKQIGTALMSYAQDYDETLPGNTAQFAGNDQPQGIQTPPTGAIGAINNTLRMVPRDIQPYVKNWAIFICPQAKPAAVASYGSKAIKEQNTSYPFNGIVMDRTLAAIPAPANIIFMREENDYRMYTAMRPRPVAPPDNAGNLFAAYNNANFDLLHQDGGNFLYCDGHVKWSKKTQIEFADFGAATTGANAVTPADKKLTNNSGGASNPEGTVQYRAAF